jgi:hypothetical protein
MSSLFGGLFQFENSNQFDLFLESVDKKSALKIIELSIVNNQQNGLYSIEESYCLYKCLSKLKENENKASDLSDNDSNRNSDDEISHQSE